MERLEGELAKFLPKDHLPGKILIHIKKIPSRKTTHSCIQDCQPETDTRLQRWKEHVPEKYTYEAIDCRVSITNKSQFILQTKASAFSSSLPRLVDLTLRREYNSGLFNISSLSHGNC